MPSCCSAGIDVPPGRTPTGDRSGSTSRSREPDGTTTKLNSPGAGRSTARVLVELTEAAPPPGRAGRLGRARRLAPPGAPDRVVRRPRGRPARRPAPGSPSTPATPRCAPSWTRLPESAPHLMKPNGEELASFTGGDADDLEADPVAAAAAAAHPGRHGSRSRAGDAGRPGAVLVNADGAWHATPPPTTVVSTVGAGDSSLFGYLLGDLRTDRPPSGSPSRWPTAAPPPAFPAPPSPTPRRSSSELVVGPTRLDLTLGG